jgi:hypothetical protein
MEGNGKNECKKSVCQKFRVYEKMKKSSERGKAKGDRGGVRAVDQGLGFRV